MFASYLAENVILGAIALLWARWSQLDLGFRRPDARRAEPWILLFILLITAELAVATFRPIEVDPLWVEETQQLSFGEQVLLFVIVGPLTEELLFRGALFSALMRRWGIWAAAIAPSLLWGFLHTQYEAWYMASIAASGILLAMIRWKSGSLYLPIGLHAGTNLLETLGIAELLGSGA